jgi:hypothetical protein
LSSKCLDVDNQAPSSETIFGEPEKERKWKKKEKEISQKIKVTQVVKKAYIKIPSANYNQSNRTLVCIL